MTVRVGIIMDPIAQIAFKKDSSLAMLLAAQARGWSLHYMEQRDLYQLAGEARARMRPLTVRHAPRTGSRPAMRSTARWRILT